MVVVGGVDPDIVATEDGMMHPEVVATIDGVHNVLEDPAVPVPCPVPVVSNN